MTITFTLSQVRIMLRVATNTPSALNRLAHQTGVNAWDLEDMAHGTKPVSAAVLRYFELTRRGGAYVGRVR